MENVYVPAPGAGKTWTVEVRGFNVPNGPQPYALVVDNGTISAPPPPPPSPEMHVGDLDGSVAAARKSWSATVTITVHDSSHLPVSGAIVTGTWSGATGTVGLSDPTDSNGVCSLTKSNIKSTIASVNFTVAGVTKAGYTYTPANHNPESDSNGTVITIKP